MQTERERAVLGQVAIKKVPINENFEEALIGYERYAFGRHSYLPPSAIAYIQTFLPCISYNTLTVFKNDMESGFAMYERMKRELSYRDNWKLFYTEVCAEIEKRKENAT